MVYLAPTGRTIAINNIRWAICHFGTGPTESLGIATVELPVGSLWSTFKLHMADNDFPMLLSIINVDWLGIYFDNL